MFVDSWLPKLSSPKAQTIIDSRKLAMLSLCDDKLCLLSREIFFVTSTRRKIDDLHRRVYESIGGSHRIWQKRWQKIKIFINSSLNSPSFCAFNKILFGRTLMVSCYRSKSEKNQFIEPERPNIRSCCRPVCESIHQNNMIKCASSIITEARNVEGF